MVWFIIATLVAFFIKGLCGFANTLIFNGILSYTANNINISPLEVVLGYPSNIILVWKERKSLNWKIWLPLTVLVVAGSIPGIFLLKHTDAGLLKVIFGIAVIIIGIEMLFREMKSSNGKSGGSKIILVLIGIISGLLCGLYGVGALLAAYVSRVSENSHEFKANICVVFVVENTIRIILYAATGILTLAVLKQVVILIPFMLAAVFLGMKSSSVLNEKVIKKIVIVLLILSGIVLIINNL
ncbi:sulfite exporter TauE/SafE family protein [uncultured Eubacterium sp.]|uniref:sulfite exporter TauE/SafE family protein n=1 Tax=uncultured Eubacterium sp. TaxID=165185 RepID=UPI0015B368F7|nr:sulfite exporter TauE/SafE family protein [uncultured Eubacterium sp.]